MPNFSLPDKNRRNLIHYAAANVNSDVLQFLLKNGSDPNEADATRNTALMIAWLTRKDTECEGHHQSF